MSHHLISRRPLSALATLLGTLVASLLVVACQPSAPPPAPVPQGAPRLVLFIVVDQMRADYLERFRPLFSAGLDRLLRESVVFSDAHQHHSDTTTAPGHATLGTGSFPSSHGIIGNGWFDRETGEDIYVMQDASHGVSPHRLLRPTLGDRMKELWPSAKVFALGGKDRSAGLTAGLQADAAFWYERRDGTATTSSYYRNAPSEESSPWLAEFHERKVLDELFGNTWEPLLAAEEMAEYGVEPLDRGLMGRSFPYAFGGASAYPDSSFYSAIYSTPFIDRFTVDLAKALIHGEGLGQDEVPDFLGVTLSALDAVGHTNGPDAPETLDTVMRIDRVLGDLLDFVDREIGLDQVVVSLSSDHGVGQVPEVRAARGLDGGRIAADGVTCIQQNGQEVSEIFALANADWMPSLLYFDRDAITAAGASYEEVRDAMANRLAGCPRVKRVLSPEQIETLEEPYDELYRNSYHPDRSADLLLMLEPNTLFGSTVASHGQAHRYDTHVPWLLRSPHPHPGTVEQRVRTADVAPTIAGILGIDLPSADGSDLIGLLEPPATGG